MHQTPDLVVAAETHLNQKKPLLPGEIGHFFHLFGIQTQWLLTQDVFSRVQHKRAHGQVRRMNSPNIDDLWSKTNRTS